MGSSTPLTPPMSQDLPATQPVLAPDLLERLLRAASPRPGLACLDLGGRFTVLTWAGGPGLCWRVEDGGDWVSAARQLLAATASACHATDASTSSTLPLPSGLVGWLGYEAGSVCEKMPPPRTPRALPDVCLWPVHGAIVLDQLDKSLHVHGSPDFIAQAAQVVASARRPASASATSPASAQAPAAAAAAPAPQPTTTWSRPAKHYRHMVQQALQRIEAGDVYQVNLAWPLQLPAPNDPIATWLSLRAANPATEGALLRHGDDWVLSNSPERYLTLEPRDAGLRVRSAPIKGTGLHAGGEAARRELRDSEKERAELTMIVDLVRNDLGRVATVGSVRCGPRKIRACGDLWHAEQTVEATVQPALDLWDVIRASFPPGSVTGAPKVAAMKLIDQLEAQPRGLYTGALAAIGCNGWSWLSVCIRIVTVHGARAQVRVGAGIVADSQPQAEWLETLAKARAIARQLGRPLPPIDKLDT